jgi:hypothetical protein
MNRRSVSFLRSKLALAVIVTLSASLFVHAQKFLSGAPGVSAQRPLVRIPEDWSHHHVVFSNPGKAEDAARKGKLEQWSRVTSDERYQMQLLRNALRVRRPLKPFRPVEASRQDLKKDWSMYMGPGATVGADQYPAKFTFDTTTASCSDFVVYNTSLAGGGSGGQANIVAYSNLYEYSSGDSSGCSGTVPSVYWAYSSGAGQAMTSTVLSSDGTKVAYVENNATSGAVLRILQWAAGEGSPQAAAVPDYVYANSTVGAPENTAWNPTNCPSGQSCLISVPFQNGAHDTIPAPFYVYSSADTIYVGDAAGNLHEFTGVFNGTPAEVTTGGWPIAVSGNVLTSPVYDSGASGNVFVADSGGYLYSFNGATANPQMRSSRLTSGSNTVGIVDAPMLDPSTEKVYVFVGDDANTTGNYPCYSTTGCGGVFQFSAGNTTIGTVSCNATNVFNWSGTNCGEEVVFGTGTGASVYDGAFDHIYLTGTGTSGYLWLCAPYYGTGPALAFVSIESNGGFLLYGEVVGTASVLFSDLTTGNSGCSPVTEN